MRIEDYLDGLKPEGLEGETLSFTLDEAKALQKLSQAQLSEQALWIVKMVQAGVNGGAAEIDIKLGRNRIEVTFDSPQIPVALELFELVRSGQIPSEPFLRHLVTGIRTSFAGEGTSFLIQTVGPNGKAVVAMSEGAAYHFEDPAVTLNRPVLSYVIRRPYRMLKFTKALDSSVSHLMKGTASEHFELMTRCWPSTVPIRIDGKLLDTRYDSPLMFRGSSSSLALRHHRQGFVLTDLAFAALNLYLRYYPVEPGQPSLPREPFQQGQRVEFQTGDAQKVYIQKPVYLDGRFLEWDYESDRAGKVLISPQGTGRETAIYFVHDGALVQRIPIKLYPPLKKNGGECLIVPVEFHDLDLSQFRVREAESRRRELLNWIWQQHLECNDVFVELLKHFYPVNSTKRKFKSAVTLAGAATLPLGWACGPMGLGIYAIFQAFYPTVGLMGRFVAFWAFKADYQKTRDEMAAFDITTIEQPPIP